MTEIMSPRDNAALAFAREKLLQMRDERLDAFAGIEAAWLDKADNRTFAVEMMKRYAMGSPANLMNLVDYARQGWGLADRALRELILEYINRGQMLPTYLAAYNMEIVQQRPPRRPAREKADYFLRDIAITSLIIVLIDRFGLTPYGRHSSACSIVAEALGAVKINMNYKAVAEVWRRYGKV